MSPSDDRNRAKPPSTTHAGSRIGQIGPAKPGPLLFGQQEADRVIQELVGGQAPFERAILVFNSVTGWQLRDADELLDNHGTAGTIFG